MNDDTIYIYDEEISTSTKKCLLIPKYFLVSFSKISFRAPSPIPLPRLSLRLLIPSETAVITLNPPAPPQTTDFLEATS